MPNKQTMGGVMPENPLDPLIKAPELKQGDTPTDVGESDGYVDYTLYLDERQVLPNLKSISGKVNTFNQMKTNSTISGILLAFKSLCQTPRITIKENPLDPNRGRAEKRAIFLRECVADMQTPMSDVIGEILDMIDMGFKIMVPQFKARTGYDTDPHFHSKYHDGKIGWRSFLPIDPTTIEKWNTPAGMGYLGLTGITQRVRRNGAEIKIPRNRMLLFRTVASNNDPTGKSILEGAYLDWVDLVDANKIQMTGLRRSLEGIPFARIDSKMAASAQTNKAHRSAILSAKTAVKNLDARRDTAFVLPSDRDEHGNLLVEVGMMGSQEGGGNTRIQDAQVVIDQKEQTIARSMLAQFMTLKGKGGSYALSKTQSEVFINSLRGYITQIEGILNGEGIPRLFSANGEGSKANDHYLPTIEFTEFIKDDVTEFFSSLQKAVEIGVFEVTPQIQSKAAQVLNVDNSGQKDLLEKRNKQREELQAATNKGVVSDGQAGEETPPLSGEDVPDTKAADITDDGLKKIIAE
jgi:hypothetical protein